MSSGVHTSSSSKKRGGSNRTVLEMFSVLLLGIATVATAWCGIQSSRWNGEETDAARTANLDRIEASRLFALASQKVAYDANLTAQYAAAVVDDNVRLQTFLRENLMRPEYLPFLDEWQTKVAAGQSVSNLFTQEDYLDAQFADSRAVTASSDVASARATESSANADDYLLTTLLTATALFFAGVTTSFGTRSARLMLVAAAAAVLAITAARLVDLPII